MSVRRNEDAVVEFCCDRDNCYEGEWEVEGRFNAEGVFEAFSEDDMGSDEDCPECGERGTPVDPDVVLSER